MNKSGLIQTIILFVLFLTLSCSENTPEINQIDWRIVLRDDGQNRYEELLLFCKFSDEDGDGDLAQLLVSIDELNLVWTIPKDDWVSVKNDWWGLPPLRLPSSRQLPNGIYKIRVEDLSGKASEYSFRPDQNRSFPVDDLWPRVKLNNSGIVEISGGNVENVFLTLRTTEGNIIYNNQVVDGENINLQDAATWEVWIPVPTINSGYWLGPYDL